MSPGRKMFSTQRILCGWMITVSLVGLLTAEAQQPREDEATRQLWDTAFINQEKASSSQENRQTKLSNCDSSGPRNRGLGRHSDWGYALAIASCAESRYRRKGYYPRRAGIG